MTTMQNSFKKFQMNYWKLAAPIIHAPCVYISGPFGFLALKDV